MIYPRKGDATSGKGSLGETLAILDKKFTRQAQNNSRLLNDALAKVPAEELSTQILRQLFDIWANRSDESYDEHMAVTGHDRAVEILIRQAMELHDMGFGKDHEQGSSKAKLRIFGDDVLEMSCGTGTIIKLLCESLPKDRGITFIGNDLSENMKSEARKKLAPFMSSIDDQHSVLKGMVREVLNAMGLGGNSDQKHRLILTGEDLRDLHMHHRIDTAILSQTLHLITDPVKLVKEQREGAEPDEHRKIKLDVIQNIFEKMPYGGHFILIDEWPPVLTQTGNSAGTDLISALFYRTLRPIMERSSITDMMKRVPDASFVAELKQRIDCRHSMYAMVYRKDDRKTIRSYGHLPMEGNEMTMARHRAMLRIYRAFGAVDTHFVKSYNHAGVDKEWVNFIPLGNNRNDTGIVQCCPGDIGMHKKLLRAGSADTVVVSQLLHTLDDNERKGLIGEAIGALKLGGALMFIEEWPPVNKDPHHFHNRDFRSMMSDLFEETMFEAALRETIVPGFDSGMYGYLFRKL